MNVHYFVYRGHLSTKAYFLPQWTAHTFTNYLNKKIYYVVLVALSTHCIFMLQISFILEKKIEPWDDVSLKLSRFIRVK